jgi:large subunit ribosomal protein L30
MKTKKILVTQTGSAIRGKKHQLKVLKCLGLGRIGKSREFELNPSIAGMVRSVSHLVSVTEVGKTNG